MPSLFFSFVVLPILSLVAWGIYSEMADLHRSPPPGPPLPATGAELFASIEGLPPMASVYNMKVPEGPVLQGWLLRLFSALLRFPFVGKQLAAKLAQDNGFQELLDFVGRIQAPEPLFYPYIAATPAVMERHTKLAQKIRESNSNSNKNKKGNPAATASFSIEDLPSWVTDSRIADLARAFHAGTLDPVQHTESVFKNIEEANPSIRAVVDVDRTGALKAARLSKERIKAGKALSLFDGVPVIVKTEVAVRGLLADFGSRLRAGKKADHDAPVVEQLRAAGLVVVGVASMVDYGAATAGQNSLHGSTRNPYDTDRITGGSSGGSAAAVAAGLVPIAIGADGGGSCRIPAALNGLVSMKQTWGRIDSPAHHEFAWSVAHICPIVATTDDARLAYELLAGSPDPRYPAPPAEAIEYADPSATASPPLAGIRIGIDRAWSSDSSPSMRKAHQKVEDQLEAAGAEIVDVKIPFLRETFLAHVNTITTEMLAGLIPHGRNISQMDMDVQASLRAFDTLSGKYYVAAQIARNYLTRNVWNYLFSSKIDVLLTPATGSSAAPAAPEPLGEINLQGTAERMRFSFTDNLIGNPAIVLPVELEEGTGLPLGIALHANSFEEGILFKVAKAVERKQMLKPNKNWWPKL